MIHPSDMHQCCYYSYILLLLLLLRLLRTPCRHDYVVRDSCLPVNPILFRWQHGGRVREFVLPFST